MQVDDTQALINDIKMAIAKVASVADLDSMQAAIGRSSTTMSLSGAAYRDTGPYNDRYQDTPYDDHYRDTPTYRDGTR